MITCEFCRRPASPQEALRHGPLEIQKYLEAGVFPAEEALQPFRLPEDDGAGKALQRWTDDLLTTTRTLWLCPHCFGRGQEAQEEARQVQRAAPSTALAASPTPDDAPASTPTTTRFPSTHVAGSMLLLLSLVAFWQSWLFFEDAAYMLERAANADPLLRAFSRRLAEALRDTAIRWLTAGLYAAIPGLFLLFFPVLRRAVAPPAPLPPGTINPHAAAIAAARFLALLAYTGLVFAALLPPSLYVRSEFLGDFSMTWWSDDRPFALAGLTIAALYVTVFCLVRLPNAIIWPYAGAFVAFGIFVFIRFDLRLSDINQIATYKAELGWSWIVLAGACLFQIAAAAALLPVPVTRPRTDASYRCPRCAAVLREGSTFCFQCRVWIR